MNIYYEVIIVLFKILLFYLYSSVYSCIYVHLLDPRSMNIPCFCNNTQYIKRDGWKKWKSAPSFGLQFTWLEQVKLMATLRPCYRNLFRLTYFPTKNADAKSRRQSASRRPTLWWMLGISGFVSVFGISFKIVPERGGRQISRAAF